MEGNGSVVPRKQSPGYWCEQLRYPGFERVLVNFDIAPAVNQVEFHPFLYQQNLLQFCEKNRIQVEAYSPLTRGERLTHPQLSKIAKKYGKTTMILIRWSLQHGLIAIPKSIHEERIRENSEMFDFQPKRKIWNFLIHSMRICVQCF